MEVIFIIDTPGCKLVVIDFTLKDIDDQDLENFSFFYRHGNTSPDLYM